MKTRYLMKIPARINILGNPTDANEGDYHTISAAISIFAGGVIEPSEKLTFQFLKKDDLENPIDSQTVRWADSFHTRRQVQAIQGGGLPAAEVLSASET